MTDAPQTTGQIDLRTEFAALADWHEGAARRDREASGAVTGSSAGATGAIAGYIFSAVTHDIAARRIREILAHD